MAHSALHCLSASHPGSLLARLSGVILGLVVSTASYAAVEISSIITSETPATPFTYTKDGIEYIWGIGSNQYMEGFETTDGALYSYALSADRVEVIRDDISGVTSGKPCGIFVERIAETTTSRSFAADYPSDGSGTGNCDLPAMLASRVINRGVVDVFSNKLPDAKNIERLDYLFDFGVLAPFSTSDMALAGHAVAEKSSNNPVKVAAILELDILGQPAAFGPLVLVGEHFCFENPVCYHLTDLQHTYSFLQNDFNEPQGFPVETERSRESVGMAFLSMSDLGLSPGQRYYGLSFFADDVDADLHNLLDPASYPDNTSDDDIVAGDDADIYGGLAGFFLDGAVTVASGRVFNDVNGDGVPGASEAGISSIAVSVYNDVNGNGVLDAGVDLQLGDSIDSDMSGNFVLPGIPDGNILVVADSNDSDIPSGLVIAAGSTPHPLAVSGEDIDTVYFPFVAEDGSRPNDDESTQAVDDTFELNQGSSIVYDVLANDTDGVGEGLTLLSVTESPNAVITVVDNEVSYRPNFGFYGDNDTFLYVMEDANGARFTGNVSVDVIRYSDLNNNMVNDYVECDCTNLVLETGVHGVGIGRLSFAGSLVLFGALWLRRKSKQLSNTGVAIAEVVR